MRTRWGEKRGEGRHAEGEESRGKPWGKYGRSGERGKEINPGGNVRGQEKGVMI